MIGMKHVRKFFAYQYTVDPTRTVYSDYDTYRMRSWYLSFNIMADMSEQQRFSSLKVCSAWQQNELIFCRVFMLCMSPLTHIFQAENTTEYYSCIVFLEIKYSLTTRPSYTIEPKSNSAYCSVMDDRTVCVHCSFITETYWNRKRRQLFFIIEIYWWIELLDKALSAFMSYVILNDSSSGTQRFTDDIIVE